jgi:hypothetical protein
VLRGKFIAMSVYIKNRSQINDLILHLKFLHTLEQDKPKTSRKDIKAKVNEIENNNNNNNNNKTTQRINETKSLLLEKVK